MRQRSQAIPTYSEHGILMVLDRPSCVHHWHIEECNGPVAVGVCQICGERRNFSTDFGLKFNSSSLEKELGIKIKGNFEEEILFGDS